MRASGREYAEIAVDRGNPSAKRLYERLGYRVIGQDHQDWSYRSPDGQMRRESAEVWTLQKTISADPESH
jgi:ribosomal protein S18 acetylase RimI-like enzyme